MNFLRVCRAWRSASAAPPATFPSWPPVRQSPSVAACLLPVLQARDCLLCCFNLSSPYLFRRLGWHHSLHRLPARPGARFGFSLRDSLSSLRSLTSFETALVLGLSRVPRVPLCVFCSADVAAGRPGRVPALRQGDVQHEPGVARLHALRCRYAVGRVAANLAPFPLTRCVDRFFRAVCSHPRLFVCFVINPFPDRHCVLCAAVFLTSFVCATSLRLLFRRDGPAAVPAVQQRPLRRHRRFAACPLLFCSPASCRLERLSGHSLSCGCRQCLARVSNPSVSARCRSMNRPSLVFDRPRSWHRFSS